MNISYLTAEAPIEASLIAEILDAAARVFDSIDSNDIRWRLENMPALSVFAARDSDRLCGFKIGYAVTSRRYNSWLGGVDPAYRRARSCSDGT